MGVLIADSNRERAAMLRRELHALGVLTATATDYDSALRFLTRVRPAALFVGDTVAPYLGTDLLAQIEHDERLDRIPTVAVVKRTGSLIARSLRRGGIRAVVRPRPRRTALLLDEIRQYPSDKVRRRAVRYWSHELVRQRSPRERLAVDREQCRLTCERAMAPTAGGCSMRDAEHRRESSEAKRCRCEESRGDMERHRETREAERQDAERRRGEAETARRVAETTRTSREQSRTIAEYARRRSEEARKIAEEARDTADSARRELADLREAVREQRQIFDEMLASARGFARYEP